METVWQDVRYAARMLARSPGFTAVAVLTLALGIGANTAIFSVVNAILLRPLPGREPSQLASVYTSDFSGPLYGTSSYPDYVDLRDHNEVFSGVAAYSAHPMLITQGNESYRVIGQPVTGNFFEVLGVNGQYGRTFAAAEDTPGAEPVVVLSHSLWQRRFGADPSRVGKTINISGQPVTIVGVAPAGFTGLPRGVGIDLWVPMNMLPQVVPGRDDLTERGDRGSFLIGRLKAGVTVEQAQANLNLRARQLFEAYPDNWTSLKGEPRVITVLPERQTRVLPMIREAVWAFLVLLQVVVGLVLLIACANVASLLLARATARRREIAVRLSLGASRWRLVRQLLTESVLLALLAGGAALLLALWATQALMAFQPPLPVTLALDLSLDAPVLLFTLLLALATGVLFGLAPALQASRFNLLGALKEEGSLTGGWPRSRLRNLLVIAQVALSLLLLMGSGLLLRSLANAEAIDPGFEPEGVLLASVDLQLQGYGESEGRALFERLQARLESLPQVESASVATILPLGLAAGRRGIRIQGYERAPGEGMEVHFNVVGPHYFETMRIPLVRGRWFTPQDTQGAPGVVIVNEAFARRYWPGQDPLGKRISMGVTEQDGRQVYPLAVVGVAQDGKYVTLGEDARPFVFYPHRQNYEADATVLVRTGGDPAAFSETLRQEIRALDPRLPVYDVRTLESHMSFALVPVRLAATLLGVFGLLALTLCCVGLYGTLSFAVSQRTREIGVRIALGARSRDVLRLVLAQGLVLTLVGMGIGLSAAAGASRFLTFLLYGISPLDPFTFLVISMLLLMVALLACYVPARRALRVDPMAALRYE